MLVGSLLYLEVLLPHTVDACLHVDLETTKTVRSLNQLTH